MSKFFIGFVSGIAALVGTVLLADHVETCITTKAFNMAKNMNDWDAKNDACEENEEEENS